MKQKYTRGEEPPPLPQQKEETTRSVRKMTAIPASVLLRASGLQLVQGLPGETR